MQSDISTTVESSMSGVFAICTVELIISVILFILFGYILLRLNQTIRNIVAVLTDEQIKRFYKLERCNNDSALGFFSMVPPKYKRAAFEGYRKGMTDERLRGPRR